ncbi:hypothetical protein ACLOAV_007933 [Pseudogymnoascus australis]
MSASAAHVATSSCLEGFGALRGHLQAAKPGLAAQVSDADIEDEFGRFRLWAANIGALSRGHGSLDYRLRDAPVVLEGALKLLSELQEELHQMCLVLSGARLPYEAQISSRAGHVDDSDASSLSSDSESSSDSSSESEDEKLAPSELLRRVSALSNINDNLYRLSRSIRAPASHSRSLKALSYKLIDKETGVDVVQQFATVDLAFTKDLFSQLRRHVQDQYGNCPMLDGADVAMIKRLAQGITRRRQQFLYWKHHRKKLGFNAERESLKIPKLAPTVQLRGDETRESVAGPPASLPVVGKAQTESSRPKTTLTETTATLFVAPATVPDGNQSVTSYATTARGLDGSRIEFPKLPKSIKKGKDFECPYCLMICPPHYQMPRAWRAHLLRDLRPYMCTHKHCQQSDELFATKQEWLNHEHTHQKAWQCPEHASAHFSTPEDLKAHLLAETHESLQRMGLEDLLAICETVRPDFRTTCPICFVDTGSSYDLENHLANHLERFAAFALPRDVDSDADEGSHNDSNMSEHAIARSDQSDVSELSHAYDWHKERIEIIGLARNLTDILSNGSSDTISDLKKLYDQMMRITDLPTEIIDTLSFDLQFNAVLKTIPKLLTELLGVVAPDSDEDNFEELTSELIFQMERLDRIIQEYAVDHALDSSHPRLGINTALSDQNPESRLKQSQTDQEPAPTRDSGVTNRTDPTLPVHHVFVEGSEDGPRTVQNIWNDTKIVRPSKIRMEPGGALIVNLTSLLTDAYRIQQRLRDFATEDKATPGAIVRLNRIFPDICLGITSLIKTIREGVVDPNAVTSIEVTDTRCRRLFEDASSFLDKFKEGTRPSWGSRTEYRNDIEQLVASAQRALQEINYILEVQARTRVIRRGREQDDPTSRPPTGGITLPTDSEVSGGLSRAGEHGQRPESSKNPQGIDDIHIRGQEDAEPSTSTQRTTGVHHAPALSDSSNKDQEKYGLFGHEVPTTDSPSDDAHVDTNSIDIVAVHGLNGTAHGTWTRRGSELEHETSDEFVAGQRESSVPIGETRSRILDSNPQTHDRPIIIDERPLRGILKPGRGKFPEDPSPTREGVALLGDEMNEGIYLRPSRAEGAPPPSARWTKINRLLVSPEALHEGRERYEARDDFVIVLRVLTKEEIQGYADATARIRAARAAEDEALYERRSKHAELKARAFEQDDSDVDDEGNNSEYERSRKSELARLPRTRRDSKGKDATNMPSTDRLSNDDVESPSSSVGVSLDSNAQKLDEIFTYAYLRQELNKILTDATLRLLFREQLRDTHCEENLSFYLDVDEFLNYCTDVMQGTSPSSLSKVSDRRLDVIKKTMASAYGIYNAFLAPGSPYELNIDHSLRSQLASCMNKAVGGDYSMIESLKEVIKLFEEAHLSVFKRMAFDSVPKFIKSAKYEQNRKNYDFDDPRYFGERDGHPVVIQVRSTPRPAQSSASSQSRQSRQQSRPMSIDSVNISRPPLSGSAYYAPIYTIPPAYPSPMQMAYSPSQPGSPSRKTLEDRFARTGASIARSQSVSGYRPSDLQLVQRGLEYDDDDYDLEAEAEAEKQRAKEASMQEAMRKEARRRKEPQDRWTAGPREAQQSTKSVSGLARSLSARSTRDTTSPASHETASGDEGKKQIDPAPGPPRAPPRPSSATPSAPYNDDHFEFPDLPPPGLQLGSNLSLAMSDDDGLRLYPRPLEDVVDEMSLGDKSLKRLKRVFSRRNWTEKGKGERRGRDKDKEDDGGGGRRSSLFRSR